MTLKLTHAAIFIIAAATTAAAVGFTRADQQKPSTDGIVSWCGGRVATPDVLFCDDFEDPDFEKRWDIGGHQGRWPRNEFVKCDRDGFGFRSSCAAWSNFLTFDHAWGYYGYDGRHAFEPQSEFYVRWYQYISDPFTWGTLEDKSVLLHDPGNTLMAYVATSRTQLPDYPNSGPGVPYVANYQDVDTPETANQYTLVNRFQNQGRKFTLKPGRWYLFEWYVKLNTPGESNGATKLWIDDATQPITKQTLRMSYSDMRWLKRTDAGKQFGVVRLTVYHQRCDIGPNVCPPNGPDMLRQSQRWDHLVVSKILVGPLKSDRPSPTQ
jgi:hypothetical protein